MDNVSAFRAPRKIRGGKFIFCSLHTRHGRFINLLFILRTHLDKLLFTDVSQAFFDQTILHSACVSSEWLVAIAPTLIFHLSLFL
jgi:hypothetical protein